MAIRYRKHAVEAGDNNIFWTTMSDLMLGLAVVFMTLFVLAISGFSEQVLEQKQQQVQASNEIVEKSSKIIFWKCHKCSYEWKSSPAIRIKKECPHCSLNNRKQKVLNSGKE